MLRRALFIAVAHLLVVLGCMALSIQSAMHGVDTGAAPSAFARMARDLGNVLLLPLARPIFERGMSVFSGGGWSYMVLGVNSLAWGLFLAWTGGLLWGLRKAGGVRLRRS
jgi:hypothetical protein